MNTPRFPIYQAPTLPFPRIWRPKNNACSRAFA